MTVGERDGNAAIRRATTILMRRHLPHLDPDRRRRRWRVSPDVRVAILSLVPEPLGVQVLADGEYLFGIQLAVDEAAPEWTIELQEPA